MGRKPVADCSKAYRVKEWDDHFENAKSRTYEKKSWTAMPNKHHGLGLKRMLAEPDGLALFGLWCLIVQACSRHGLPRDGWLTADGRPRSAPWRHSDMALMWGRPIADIERGLAFLVDPEQGWMELIAPPPAHPADIPAVSVEHPLVLSSSVLKEGRGEVPKPAASATLARSRKLVIKELGRLFLDTSEKAVDEWIELIRAAEIRNAEEGAAFLAFAVRQKRDCGKEASYARHCVEMPSAWQEWAKARFWKPRPPASEAS